jgi:hypothetical protein
MTEGWVYVMRHPLWDRIGETGAVKIGHTRTDPAKRGLQIASASGLLRPPSVAFCAWVADRAAVEKAVHRQLDRYRVRSRREMFAVTVETARSVIEASGQTRAVTLRRPSSRRSRWPRLQRRILGGLLLLLGCALSISRY